MHNVKFWFEAFMMIAFFVSGWCILYAIFDKPKHSAGAPPRFCLSCGSQLKDMRITKNNCGKPVSMVLEYSCGAVATYTNGSLSNISISENGCCPENKGDV